MAARLLQFTGIGNYGAWVILQVFRVGKLRRVHKNAADNDIAQLAACASSMRGGPGVCSAPMVGTKPTSFAGRAVRIDIAGFAGVVVNIFNT
jgi:hypothetical protein